MLGLLKKDIGCGQNRGDGKPSEKWKKVYAALLDADKKSLK